jgi:arylsulfatase A-like enzyme
MLFILCSALIATLSACSCGSDGESEQRGSAESAGAESRPDEYRDHRIHLNLLEASHLADVDHQGLYLDFGTPADAKYTVGGWNSGWGSQVSEGDTTARFVGRRGRIYFHADRAEEMVVRLNLRPHGTRALTPYINNEQLRSIHFGEGEGFQSFDFTLPADLVKAGENYLLLTFGGTTAIGDENVSVALAYARIAPGTAFSDSNFNPPNFDAMVGTVAIDDEERQSVIARRPTSISYYVEVPEQSVLTFGVGLEGQGEAPVSVTLTPEEGQSSELFSGTATSEWSNEAADLSAYAGKVVRLTFDASSTGPGRVAWSTPAVVVAPPEQEPEVQTAQNVIVLLIDTLRADKLRPYNPQTRVTTPHLDRVATEGAVFEGSQSPENWTKPACASILTGLYPMSHGAKDSDSRLPDDALLLSEHLQAQGFQTGSFIANGYVSDRFGFDQGWNHYTNYIRESKSTEAANVFREAGDWIEANQEERFFAYIHTIDPHVPYDPPAEYLRQYDDRPYEGQVRPRMTPDLLEQAKRNPPAVTFNRRDRERLAALYDAEISQHDHFFGQFIERMTRLGLWENTLVIITSDHGEEFNDHGSWGHGHSVYQELLRVPLIFRLPGAVPAEQRIADAVGTLSIPATALDVLGLPPMPLAEGPSLAGYFQGLPLAGPQVAFSDFQEERRVITSRRWKFILRGNLTAAMFDLERDPGEREQLALTRYPIAERYLRVNLSQFLGSSNRAQWTRSSQAAGASLQGEQAEMDETIREQLRALGYAN